jgi:hypothetical protein
MGAVGAEATVTGCGDDAGEAVVVARGSDIFRTSSDGKKFGSDRTVSERNEKQDRRKVWKGTDIG